MFLTSIVLSVGLTNAFAGTSIFPNVNQENLNFGSQQIPPMRREDQLYSSNMTYSPMEGNQNMYPIPQQSMMQGFQPQFPFNPINQQQLSLLLMSTYARMISLMQLINMQNRYQPYNQYYDPAVNNFVQTPVPLPYAQQPQVEPQNNLQNELLQQQQQQAEAQQKALEERRIQSELDMEVQRQQELKKRQKEEDELEKKQKEIERRLLDEAEIERERKEAEQQILEEEKNEQKKIEDDRKLREEEELRFKRCEQEKLKQKARAPQKVARKPRKTSTTTDKIH
ncbi:unnamed protein product [Aphis gossypii]|uniref:Uncharacterized protein n=2 Tax=Aphis gossypii TaxID=80765 RepID=A0A9P0J1H9_APHGO|nr:unnamed protein product [Aphis gossypii]